MRRLIHGVGSADASSAAAVPDGLLLAQVQRVQFRRARQKLYYELRFEVLEPKKWARRSVTGRLYCSPKALWKLNWFLRDFGYDLELLGRDEIDDKSLVGLQGVVRVGNVVVKGTSCLNLDGFAPSTQWEELMTSVQPSPEDPGGRP